VRPCGSSVDFEGSVRGLGGSLRLPWGVFSAAVFVFFGRSAGAFAASGGFGGWFTNRSQITGDKIAGVTIRSRFCGFSFIFSYLAVDFVPVGFFAVHDGLDLRVQIVEEFFFFCLGWRFRLRVGLCFRLGLGSRFRALQLVAFFLELFELINSTVEDAGGVGTGSFDGADFFYEHGVEERVEGGVAGDVAIGEVAAAETPGGAGDLGGEALFDGVGGIAAAVHVGDEEVVDVGFFGENEVVKGVQTSGYSVAGGGLAPFLSLRPG
jgi:hypothetical protein